MDSIFSIIILHIHYNDRQKGSLCPVSIEGKANVYPSLFNFNSVKFNFKVSLSLSLSGVTVSCESEVQIKPPSSVFTVTPAQRFLKIQQRGQPECLHIIWCVVSFKERYVIILLLSFVQDDNRGVMHAKTHWNPHTRTLTRGVRAGEESMTGTKRLLTLFVSLRRWIWPVQNRTTGGPLSVQGFHHNKHACGHANLLMCYMSWAENMCNCTEKQPILLSHSLQTSKFCDFF